jgi:hypothetical protein
MQQNDPTQISGSTVAVGAPEAYKQLSHPADVSFLLQGLQPPSRVYIGVDDQLAITIKSPRQNCSFTVGYRILRTDGLIIPFAQSFFFTPPVNQFVLVPLTEGFLLSFNITVNAGAAEAAGYVRADIARQAGSNNPQIYESLVAGYLSTLRALSYPETPPARPTDGRGAIVSITGASPAAGADSVEVVPAGRLWRLMSWRGLFIASATVASRSVTFQIDDGSNNLTREGQNNAITAGQGGQFFVYSTPFNGSDTGLNFFLWNDSAIILGPGFRLKTVTQNIQAGDQWSAIQYLVEEWQTQ